MARCERDARSDWERYISLADAHNEPGVLTTFAAYEYTSSSDDRGNLHRNVIFQNTDRLPTGHCLHQVRLVAEAVVQYLQPTQVELRRKFELVGNAWLEFLDQRLEGAPFAKGAGRRRPA